MTAKKGFYVLTCVVYVLALAFGIFMLNAEKTEAATRKTEEATDNSLIYWAYEPTGYMTIYDEEEDDDVYVPNGTLHLGNTEYTDDKYTETGSFGIGEKFSFSDPDESLSPIVDFLKQGNLSPWIRSKINNKITKVTIDGIIQPLTTACWFKDFYYLKTIENLDRLDTSKVTDMYSMFDNCYNLTSLDVTGFDTSNVTDMAEMFDNCYNLTSLDVTGFDTSNVTDMDCMFYNCENLTSLDVTSFDTFNVTDMSCMFYNCENLTSLDVTGFDTSQVTDMSFMFYSCDGLTSLDLTGFDTSQVTCMSDMFSYCWNLTTIYASDFTAASNVYNSSIFYNFSMFDNCKKLVGGNGTAYSYRHINIKYARVDSKGTPGYFTLPDSLKKDTDGNNATGKAEESAENTQLIYWAYEPTGYKTIYEEEEDYYYEYGGGSRYLFGILHLGNTEYTGDKYDEKGSFTIEMNFSEEYEDDPDHLYPIPWEDLCEKIDKVKIDGFIQPLTTACWFNSLFYLEKISHIERLDTSKVTDMNDMFYDCYHLTSLDVTGFDTSNVTDMSGMFENCSALKSLDVTGFDTSKVTNMSRMFNKCERLKSLDVTGFDTSNVTDMSAMFSDCYNLTSLDVTGFDTSNVTDMGAMFWGSNLTSLDVTGFDTSNVTNMRSMFWECSNLTSLDLSGFDTSKVTDMSCMFDDCRNLTTIYASDFTAATNVDSSYMFSGCKKLVGGNGTTYSKKHRNIKYARVDSEGTPGYFTLPDSLKKDTDETIITDKGDESELTRFLTETLSAKILKVSCRPEDAVKATTSEKQYKDADGNIIKDSFVITSKGYTKYVGKDGKLVRHRFIAYTDEQTGRTTYYYARKTGVIAKKLRVKKKYTVDGKTENVIFFAGSDRALCYNEFVKDRKGNTLFARSDGTLACSGEYETKKGTLTFDDIGRVVSRKPDEK